MSTFKIFFAVLLRASFAFGAANQPDEKWFRCTADDECAEINYTCAGGVVNKRYLKEANEFYQQLNSQANCIQISPTEAQKKIPYKVFCKSGKCGVQGVSPKKPGFS